MSNKCPDCGCELEPVEQSRQEQVGYDAWGQYGMQTMPQFGTQTYMPYGMPGYYPGGTYGTFSYPGMYGMYGMPPGYGQYGMPAGQPLYGTYSYPGNTSPGYFGGYPGGYVPREPETGQSQ